MNYDELLDDVQWAVHTAFMLNAAGSRDDTCRGIAEAVIPVVTDAVLERIDAACWTGGAVLPELGRIDAEWGSAGE